MSLSETKGAKELDCPPESKAERRKRLKPVARPKRNRFSQSKDWTNLLSRETGSQMVTGRRWAGPHLDQT